MNLRRKANNFWRDGFYLYLCNPFRNRNIGGVAEWSMAAVLKTVERQRSGGSNPSASASKRLLRRRFSRRLRDYHPFSPSPLRVGPPGDMPIPLRFIGCLPVVASLLPPGTAADAAFGPSGHPVFPRCFAAAPRGMPIPLRSIGCLPVVASLLPPGTAADAAFGPQKPHRKGCRRAQPDEIPEAAEDSPLPHRRYRSTSMEG